MPLLRNLLFFFPFLRNLSFFLSYQPFPLLPEDRRRPFWQRLRAARLPEGGSRRALALAHERAASRRRRRRPVHTGTAVVHRDLHRLRAGGLPGAAVATLGIFLPAFALVAVMGPFVPRLRQSKLLGAFLDGVNVAALALMGSVTLQFARPALTNGPTIALFFASAATFTPSRKAPRSFDCRSRGTNGPMTATRAKAGRKMPSVATAAPGRPPST